jgi:hypothetical protein
MENRQLIRECGKHWAHNTTVRSGSAPQLAKALLTAGFTLERSILRSFELAKNIPPGAALYVKVEIDKFRRLFFDLFKGVPKITSQSDGALS